MYEKLAATFAPSVQGFDVRLGSNVDLALVPPCIVKSARNRYKMTSVEFRFTRWTCRFFRANDQSEVVVRSQGRVDLR